MPQPDSPCEFTALFVSAFESGAGHPHAKRGQRLAWTVPLFRKQLVAKLQQASTLTVTDVSDDAIRTWKDGKSVPYLPKAQLIAEVFHPADEAAQDAMIAAWRASQGPRAKRPPAPPEPPRAAVWTQDAMPAIPGVIALSIRDPELDNDPDRPGWRIGGRLLLGENIVETTAPNNTTMEMEPVYIRLGIKPGLLLAIEGNGVTYDNPKPADDAPHVEVAPGGWRINGPTPSNSGLLDGTAFDGITLAHVLHWPEDGKASLTFSITAPGPLLRVVEVDEEGEPKPEPSRTKSKLIDLVLEQAMAGPAKHLQRVKLMRLPPA